MSKIVINAFGQVKPEFEGELKKQLSIVADASLKEKGVEYYQPTINVEDPTKFHVFEVYSDETAFQGHLGGAFILINTWIQKSGALVAPLVIERHALV